MSRAATEEDHGDRSIPEEATHTAPHVGPWAMLDVFVMSVLVALVKLGELTPC